MVLTMDMPVVFTDRFYDPFAGGINRYLHRLYEKKQLFRGESAEVIEIAEHFHEVIWPQSLLPIFNDATIAPVHYDTNSDERADLGQSIWTKGL
jgi:hypothetical protein